MIKENNKKCDDDDDDDDDNYENVLIPYPYELDISL